MKNTQTTDTAGLIEAPAPMPVTHVYSPGWVPLAPAPQPPHFDPATAPPLPPWPPEPGRPPRWRLWLAAAAIAAALALAGVAIASSEGTDARIVPTDEPAPAVEGGEDR